MQWKQGETHTYQSNNSLQAVLVSPKQHLETHQLCEMELKIIKLCLFPAWTNSRNLTQIYISRHNKFRPCQLLTFTKAKNNYLQINNLVIRSLEWSLNCLLGQDWRKKSGGTSSPFAKTTRRRTQHQQKRTDTCQSKDWMNNLRHSIPFRTRPKGILILPSKPRNHASTTLFPMNYSSNSS